MNGQGFSNGGSRTDFQSSFRWAQQFIPQIQGILGRYTWRISTNDEDRKQAADLILLESTAGKRLACRIRTPGYGHHSDFTITFRRETGAPCEYHKMILGGLSDWFFYGHTTNRDPNLGTIRPYVLIDLHKARPIIIDGVKSGRLKEAPYLRNRDEPGRGCFFLPVPFTAVRDAIIGADPPIPDPTPPPFIVRISGPALPRQSELELGPLIRKAPYH